MIKIKFFLGLRYILSFLRESEAKKIQGALLGLYVVDGGKSEVLTYKKGGGVGVESQHIDYMLRLLG